jgi:hypothetical protein
VIILQIEEVRDYALQQEGNEREEERKEKRLLWEVRTPPIPIIFS